MPEPRGECHHIVRVVDALECPLADHGDTLDLPGWFDTKLGCNLHRQIVGEGAKVSRRNLQLGGETGRLRQLLYRDEMPLQHLRWNRVDEHLDVRVCLVDKDDLRECRRGSLYRDAVVLVLIDEIDTIRHTTRGAIIGGIIKHHWTVAHEVASRSRVRLISPDGQLKT